ncbi:MAG: short-chain alcohol dehydrogenase/reductase [Panacagrimonas sp.]|jgi:NAD(P)-dependent dehydrogenase (short-subunit alcohol dehydrogenase family)|nr:SDR family oxidoreductase [Panacagrimonas sp.]MCC2659031.1 short-chain alcohol dehydrogenase/reductase [Panacagrimonas sp.]
MRLEGKVALITGGTSGIGRACAERFVQEGARLVLCGRRIEAGQAVVQSLGKENAHFEKADVVNESDVRSLVQRTLERFGQIDCVINNAGTTSATCTLAESRAEDFDYDMALHVRAAFLAMKYASPHMAKLGQGSFINMSSISARGAGYNTFGYEVAKAALLHLTRCAAVELGEQGIRVNAISPGPTMTPIFAAHAGGDTDRAEAASAAIEAAFLKALPAVQALKGMVQPRDIADAALFLASDEARFVNGHDLVVDGGITAGRPASQMRATWEVLAAAAAS